MLTSTVRTEGTIVLANASREAERSVITIGVAPAALAARRVTSPIGPAPLIDPVSIAIYDSESDEPDQQRVSQLQSTALHPGQRDGERLEQRSLLERDRIRKSVQPSRRMNVEPRQRAVEGRGREEHNVHTRVLPRQSPREDGIDVHNDPFDRNHIRRTGLPPRPLHDHPPSIPSHPVRSHRSLQQIRAPLRIPQSRSYLRYVPSSRTSSHSRRYPYPAFSPERTRMRWTNVARMCTTTCPLWSACGIGRCTRWSSCFSL